MVLLHLSKTEKITGRNTFSCDYFYFSKRQRPSSLITTSVMSFNSRCQPLTRQTLEWKQGPFRPETLDSYCSSQREISFSLHRPTIKKTVGRSPILTFLLELPATGPGARIQFGCRPRESLVPSNRGQWCTDTHNHPAPLSPSGKKGAHVYIFAAL